jgi:GDPmannose 4,6-dehydratase
MVKKALITGITGQDGSYLAELLLDKGYEVHGLVRRVASESHDQRYSRISHIEDQLKLHKGIIEDYSNMIAIFNKIKPDECYHLAAQSFVHESFEDGFSTLKMNITGTRHVLSALHNQAPNCRLYFAASSEMFGKVREVPQTEKTPFYPRSPYGVSKVDGFWLTTNYRESYGIFASNGILFNHESPRRGDDFISRKITRAISKIKHGQDNVLALGNIDAKRDWGFAGDYVKAMWLMLQQDKPGDYVIATGETHSVKEFLDLAFQHAGLKYELVDLHELSEENADKEIKKLKAKKDQVFVVQHPNFFRPAEVDLLLGDPSKAKKELGWKPEVSFEQLVKMMMEHDLKNGR